MMTKKRAEKDREILSDRLRSQGIDPDKTDLSRALMHMAMERQSRKRIEKRRKGQ